MGHRSLVGPFILIAIGILILIHNLGYDLSLFEMAALYWPFILVAWGGLRLVEILAGALRSEPIPQNGITGGEWALVILICLIGSGTNLAREKWPSARIKMHGLEVFGEAFDFPVSGRIDSGPAPRVLVENLNGNVRIVGGDAAEVTVEGRTTVRAFDATDAEQTNSECPLEIVEQAGQIVVRTNHGQATGDSRISTDLEIVIPKGASVEGRGREGDFDIANIDGNVNLESRNSGVRLTEVGGDARVDLRRSDIIRVVKLAGSADIRGRGRDIELEAITGQVTINGSYSGELTLREISQPLVFESKRTKVRVERIPGTLRMALGDLSAKNLVGPVTLSTDSSFDVEINGFSGPMNLEIDRGDVELRPGQESVPPIDVKVRSGDIDLALLESARFGLDAATDHGEAINEYGDTLSVEMTGEERGAKMTGPPGRPATITLRTERGDIVVRRSSGSEDSEAAEPIETESVRLNVEQH